jgi:Sugar phosphate isomerases/epimerases
MNCYATLFINWIAADNGHLEYLLQKRIKPEVGLQHGGFTLPPDRHKEVAAIIKDHGLGCSIHLPFFGIQPGVGFDELWRSSRETLLRALEIAAWYEPDHLIGHPEYHAEYDSRAADLKQSAQDAADWPGDRWLERSAQIWAELLQLSPARLYLENTNDQSPRAILSLLEFLPDQAAMCFDLGHWFSAAGGSTRRNLPQWIELAAARLGHLHLHDNHGREDLHLGIGRGEIDFDEFLSLLRAQGLRLTLTLEAHSIENLNQSLAWLGKLPPDSPLIY